MITLKKDNEIKYTRKSYNSKTPVATYTRRVAYGLWESEKLIFSKYINKTDAILDVGCGAGRTTFALKNMGFDNIAGLDVSNKLIAFAKKHARKNKINIPFVCADAQHTPFGEENFDACIFSYNGLMCVPNSEIRYNIMKEVHRVLKPNGIFIFTTHDRDDKRYRDFWDEEKIRWLTDRQDPRLFEYGDRIYSGDEEGEGFIHIPSQSEIIEMIEENGFKLVYKENSDKIAKQTENKYFSDVLFWVIQKV